MRALGYIRVSKSSEDGVSPDVQRARISPLHSQQGSLTRCHSAGARSVEHDSVLVLPACLFAGFGKPKDS